MKQVIRVLATVAVVAALAVHAPAGHAQEPPDTVCQFTGDIRFSPGISLVAPSPTASYQFTTTSFVCAGSITVNGSLYSTGSVDRNLAISGTFNTPFGCSGVVAGSLGAGLIAGTLAGNCGRARIDGAHIGVPNPWNQLVSVVKVTGTVVFS